MKTRISRKFHLLLTTLLVFGLAACSSDKTKPGYYNEVETPSLEIPEGLDEPSSDSALVIQAPYMPPPTMRLRDVPPRISSTTSGIDANSRLSWSAQGLYLLVEDTPESVYRRLGLVIERSGMQRIRIDEDGVYRFDYYQEFDDGGGFFRKMAFWSRDKSEDYSGAYQTFTQPEGENTRVYIKYADGTDCEPDAAEHVLAVLGARMG
jgi:uncharacterized lipoprotein